MKTINISSRHSIPWLRQFPGGVPEWDGWRFIFNAEEEDYDYLVAFDDLHTPLRLRCLPENTIHVAGEPPAICQYEENYLAQFAWCITQDDSRHHAGRILYPSGLNWFIGWQPGKTDLGDYLNFEQLEAVFDTPKTKLLSVISSNKTSKQGHSARLDFSRRLKEHYGDRIDFFGRGIRPFSDKLEVLANYRFHVVIENSTIDDYFTEKLTDCLIAGSYPLYIGCRNVDRYFPKAALVQLDLSDFEKSVSLIDQAIADELDRKNREAVSSARDMAMRTYNLFPLLIDIIGQIEEGRFGNGNEPVRYANEILPFSNRRYRKGFCPRYFPWLFRHLYTRSARKGTKSR